MEVEPTEELGDGPYMFGKIPTVNQFSEELVEALDPENGIEEEYMPYNNPVGKSDKNHV